MTTLILPEIPNPYIPSTITTYQLPLIRMYNHVIDRHAMHIIPLHITTPRIPDLDRAVLGRRNEPFGFAVKRHARDVTRVPVECQDCVGVGGFDVVELDGVVARGGEVALIGGDA